MGIYLDSGSVPCGLDIEGVMFAIVQLGSRQFKVSKDQIFLAEKVGKPIGETFQAPILILADGAKTQLASSKDKAGTVTLKVLEEVKSDKIRGFKYKRRKNYMRTWGIRQKLHKLQVVSIT